MRRLRPGSKQILRGINRNLILNLIKQQGAISRARLAELTSLAPATISEIVALLLEERLVIETNQVVSERRGPRPVLLELNRRGRYAIGVMLRPDGMNLVAVDMLADVVGAAQRPIVAGGSPAEVLGRVAQAVRDLVREESIAWDDVLGVGVGTTGVIDSTTGMCHDAYIMGWHHVAVGPMLSEALGIPVHVDNDTRTLTIAEQHFGHGQNHQNFVLVTIGRGVGMGAVVTGELLRGQRDIGPEFGHITMRLDGPLCPCGKRGCLEAIASDVGLLRAASALGLAGPAETIETLTDRARADERLGALFNEAGVALGVGIANLINLFAPEVVVLTGEGLRAGGLLLDPLRATLPRCTFGDRAAQTELIITPWDPSWQPWARGAASLVLDDLLRLPLYEQPR